MDYHQTWSWVMNLYKQNLISKKAFVHQAWCLGMSNFDIIKIIKEKK